MSADTCALQHGKAASTNRRALLKMLKPLATKHCPFANLPTSKSGQWGDGVTAEEIGDYVWFKPEVLAEIKFAEWTKAES